MEKKQLLLIILVKYLKIDNDTRVEPVAGNDTYLTIDSRLAVRNLSDT